METWTFLWVSLEGICPVVIFCFRSYLPMIVTLTRPGRRTPSSDLLGCNPKVHWGTSPRCYAGEMEERAAEAGTLHRCGPRGRKDRHLCKVRGCNETERIHFHLLRASSAVEIPRRGTVGHADVITDFMCRPVLHEFSPSMKGHVHEGILKSAQYVIDSVFDKLQEALREAPHMPILVTGE